MRTSAISILGKHHMTVVWILQAKKKVDHKFDAIFEEFTSFRNSSETVVTYKQTLYMIFHTKTLHKRLICTNLTKCYFIQNSKYNNSTFLKIVCSLGYRLTSQKYSWLSTLKTQNPSTTYLPYTLKNCQNLHLFIHSQSWSTDLYIVTIVNPFIQKGMMTNILSHWKLNLIGIICIIILLNDSKMNHEINFFQTLQ